MTWATVTTLPHCCNLWKCSCTLNTGFAGWDGLPQRAEGHSPEHKFLKENKSPIKQGTMRGNSRRRFSNILVFEDPSIWTHSNGRAFPSTREASTKGATGTQLAPRATCHTVNDTPASCPICWPRFSTTFPLHSPDREASRLRSKHGWRSWPQSPEDMNHLHIGQRSVAEQ